MVRTFQPNCSLPPLGTNFVYSPPNRGTLDIFWSCILLIFLCTWSVQHEPVPVRSSPITGRQKLQRYILLARRKFRSMLVTLVAPEAKTALALGDWFLARYETEQMADFAREDDVEWTNAHSFFANLGGFGLCFDDETLNDHTASSASGNAGVSHNSKERAWTRCRWTISSATEISRKGDDRQPRSRLETYLDRLSGRIGRLDWSIDDKNDALAESILHDSNTRGAMTDEIASIIDSKPWLLDTFRGNILFLPACRLNYARGSKMIGKLPAVSEDEIMEKGDGDNLVKGLAILQCLWLVLQLTARRIDHLAFSQLEIATLAFTVCTIVTYLLSWNKVQNPRAPIYIRARRPNARDMVNLALIGPRNNVPSRGISTHITDFPGGGYTDIYTRPFYWRQFLGSILGAVAFGTIHLFAWNLVFPTVIEQLLWRVAVISTIAFPLVGVPTIAIKVLWDRSRRANFKLSNSVFSIIWYTCLFFYLIARVFIIVEMFRSLFFLPPEAYISTWTPNLPLFD